jgi:hypothetical protein
MKVMRDLTRAQFQRALAKNRFRQVLMWIEDISGECPGVSWGVIILAGSSRIARRGTLAKVLRERAAEIARRGRGQP